MGIGASISKTTNEQQASAFITQQFAGTCDVLCQNQMSDVTIDIINSNVGGVKLTQTCSSNPNCIIGSSLGATADIILKAANSANAAKASSWFSINFDKSSIKNLNNIRENISQSTNQQCNISSVNEMNDISILALNSNIGGDIALSQTGSTNGNCQLTSSTTAAANASSDVTNQARSGKGSNKDKTGKLALLTNIAIIVAVCFVIYIIAKIISGNSKSSESAKDIAELTAAKIAAGCPGGGKPLMNQQTNKPLINPRTHGLYCPPPSTSTLQSPSPLQSPLSSTLPSTSTSSGTLKLPPQSAF